MLELHLSGASIEAVVHEAHDEALARTGVMDKMIRGVVEPSDYKNFSIKSVDFINAISKRPEANAKPDKIGFVS